MHSGAAAAHATQPHTWSMRVAIVLTVLLPASGLHSAEDDWPHTECRFFFQVMDSHNQPVHARVELADRQPRIVGLPAREFQEPFAQRPGAPKPRTRIPNVAAPVHEGSQSCDDRLLVTAPGFASLLMEPRRKYEWDRARPLRTVRLAPMEQWSGTVLTGLGPAANALVGGNPADEKGRFTILLPYAGDNMVLITADNTVPLVLGHITGKSHPKEVKLTVDLEPEDDVVEVYGIGVHAYTATLSKVQDGGPSRGRLAYGDKVERVDGHVAPIAGSIALLLLHWGPFPAVVEFSRRGVVEKVIIRRDRIRVKGLKTIGRFG